jgi:hypothetical protein
VIVRGRRINVPFLCADGRKLWREMEAPFAPEYTVPERLRVDSFSELPLDAKTWRERRFTLHVDSGGWPTYVEAAPC